MKHNDEEFARNIILSLKSPTRASIFYQLARRPESTATEVSEILGEDADVVYYHLKLLRKAGLITGPRVVVRGNYVEKYYSLRSDFKEKLLRSLNQLSESEKALSTRGFRDVVIALLTVVQSILSSSIKMLKIADSATIDRIRKEDSVESKIVFCSKERYDQLLANLRAATRGDVLETFDPTTKGYAIAVIAIPRLERAS